VIPPTFKYPDNVPSANPAQLAMMEMLIATAEAVKLVIQRRLPRFLSRMPGRQPEL
jgi:hypothetical protein